MTPAEERAFAQAIAALDERDRRIAQAAAEVTAKAVAPAVAQATFDAMIQAGYRQVGPTGLVKDVLRDEQGRIQSIVESRVPVSRTPR